MTLEEIQDHPAITVQTHKNGGKYILVLDSTSPIIRECFSLSDYVVSTVSGPVLWLVPRKKETAAG